MYPHSDRFMDAVLQDHISYVKLEVYKPTADDPIFVYDPALETDDAASSTMKIVDGSVTHDKQSSTRMRLQNLKIVDPTFALVPNGSGDIFSPFGNEVVVYRGITYDDGTSEALPLGRFRMTSVNCEDKAGAATISISGYDRSWTVASNVFDHYWPYNPDAATPFPYKSASYAAYVRGMLGFAYPDITFDADEDTWTSRQSDPEIIIDPNNYGSFYANPGDNPWARAYELMRTVGCSLFFDRLGVCTLQTDPAFIYTNPDTIPDSVRILDEDDESMMTDVARVLDGEKVFNRVIVTGIGAALDPTPLRSDPAEDLDPASPTFVDGSFGPRLKMVSSNYITDKRHANAYAQLVLRTTIGKQRAVSVGSIVDACYDIDDLFTVTRARIGLDAQQFVVDNVTFPLKPDAPMQIRLREIRNIPGVT